MSIMLICLRLVMKVSSFFTSLCRLVEQKFVQQTIHTLECVATKWRSKQVILSSFLFEVKYFVLLCSVINERREREEKKTC